MVIFVIVGMPASGKNIARLYAESNDIPYFATGDIVREELSKRGLTADAANTATVSSELRGHDGMGVTRIALDWALGSKSVVAFMEGMRSWQEVELIRSQSTCVLIAFIAPREIRKQRIVSRGRPDDSPQNFDIRDERELSYGAAVPIALADAYILNTGSMDAAMCDLEKILKCYTEPEKSEKNL